MTTKERLNIISQIEGENKNHTLKWNVKKLYSAYAKSGQYGEAWLVLHLLRREKVTLLLDDASWNVQCALEDLNCHIWYSSNGNKAIAYLVSEAP